MTYRTINPANERVLQEFFLKKAASILRQRREHFARVVSGYGRELAELGIGEFVSKKLIRAA